MVSSMKPRQANLRVIEWPEVSCQLQTGNHAGVEGSIVQGEGVNEVQHAICGLYILLQNGGIADLQAC